MIKHNSDTIQTLLTGEGQLLELISTGAPLDHVLDRICTTLDLQVGNVVSVVFFMDDEEHSTKIIAQAAAEFGLSLFCCAAILSSSEELLGTLEMYSCLDRGPTLRDGKLIERATQLAALAIQSYDREQDSERFPFPWRSAMRGRSREEPPTQN